MRQRVAHGFRQSSVSFLDMVKDVVAMPALPVAR
jgi:hypothetical protein